MVKVWGRGQNNPEAADAANEDWGEAQSRRLEGLSSWSCQRREGARLSQGCGWRRDHVSLQDAQAVVSGVVSWSAWSLKSLGSGGRRDGWRAAAYPGPVSLASLPTPAHPPFFLDLSSSLYTQSPAHQSFIAPTRDHASELYYRQAFPVFHLFRFVFSPTWHACLLPMQHRLGYDFVRCYYPSLRPFALKLLMLP